MSRVLPVLGVLLVSTAAASAQTPPTRLDHIDHKLDLILHRLDQIQSELDATRSGPPAVAARPSTAPAGTSPPAPAKEIMAAGAVVIVHAAPTTPVTARQIPSDSVGGFIYTGGTLQLANLKDHGVRYAGLAGIEWQGWLRAKTSGRYEFELDGSTVSPNNFTHSTCIFAGWLQDRPIDIRQATPNSGIDRPADFSLVLGADLSPGLYKLRLWATCTPSVPNEQVSATLLEKTPSDLNMRPITGEDIVHKPAASGFLGASG